MGDASESVVDGKRRTAHPAPAPTPDPDAADLEEGRRSGYGTVPGAEFPTFVYISVLIAFAWIMLASWWAFAGGADASLALGMATVLAIVFFGLPAIMRLVAISRSPHERDMADDFLSSRVETATGALSGSSAWLQVLLIPLALALAATLIGAIYVLVT